VVDTAELFDHLSDHTPVVYGSPIVCNFISPEFTPRFRIFMATQLTCGACGRHNLSQTGYWSHLRQSRRRECVALYQELLHAVEERQDSSTPTVHGGYDDQDDSDDLSSAPQPFAGDAFGASSAYVDDEFGQGEEDATSLGEVGNNEDDEDDDEDDTRRMDDFRQEDGWEPSRHGGVEGHPNAMDVDDEDDAEGSDSGSDNDEDDDDESGLQLNPSLQAGATVTVKYSSVYPQKDSGKPIGRASANDLEYQHSLGSSNLDFAPFISKIDWEIAKWAKLRGPGSTAFSELLRIEGVRYTSICA
jgi:hypothetical protein